jgi:LytS/YehU family sensor histidine kinase
LVFIFFGNYKMHKMDPTSFDAVFLFVGLYFIIFVATALILIQHSFEIQKSNNLLNSKRYKTELKLKEAELKLLKAQIHPHFLFNTLNNLYGLTLEKSEEAPNLVLRLSEILDYILYRCEEKYVPLSEELNNLKSYIEIEKIRYSDMLNLDLDFPDNPESLLIAPLILLPYVENSFKHGISKHSGVAFIKMKIKVFDKNLIFSIENSNTNSKQNENYTKGIGLNNVKKRLDLMYPEKYILSISNKAESFSVNLTLQLEK